MQSHTRSWSLPLVGALALLGAASVPAQAQLYQGYTDGCFAFMGTCTPDLGNVGWEGSDAIYELAFKSSSFAGNGPVFGAAPDNNLNREWNNFGAFYLGRPLPLLPAYFTPYNFVLGVTFDNPASPQNIFTASLTGMVTFLNGGNLAINFDNTPKKWQASNGKWYSVWVDDVTLDLSRCTLRDCAAGTSAQVVGHVSQVTPEPASMMLLGTGLAGLIGAKRRRRRNQAEA